MSEQSSTNADQQNNNDSSELVEKKEIPETPFTAVRLGDKWFLTMGKYRLTSGLHGSYEEIFDEAMNTSWNRILQIMQIMIEENEQEKLKKAQERIMSEFYGPNNK